MSAKINLLNKKFGKLTVIGQSDERDGSGSIIWLCRCEDGNLKKVSSRSLMCGTTKSCGCLWSENLIGKKYGKLIVMEKTKIKPKNVDGQFWSCRCECGNTKDVLAEHLLNGEVASCGCIRHLKRSDSPLWIGYGEISGSFWNSIKISANKRGIKFNITIQYAWDLFLKQNRKCALSGIDLVFEKYSYDSDKTASLDRIDSSKGYIIGNLQWIHKDINKMKRDYDDAYFIDMCKKIAMNRR